MSAQTELVALVKKYNALITKSASDEKKAMKIHFFARIPALNKVHAQQVELGKMGKKIDALEKRVEAEQAAAAKKKQAKLQMEEAAKKKEFEEKVKLAETNVAASASNILTELQTEQTAEDKKILGMSPKMAILAGAGAAGLAFMAMK